MAASFPLSAPWLINLVVEFCVYVKLMQIARFETKMHLRQLAIGERMSQATWVAHALIRLHALYMTRRKGAQSSAR